MADHAKHTDSNAQYLADYAGDTIQVQTDEIYGGRYDQLVEDGGRRGDSHVEEEENESNSQVLQQEVNRNNDGHEGENVQQP